MSAEAAIQEIFAASTDLSTAVGNRIAYGARIQGSPLPSLSFETTDEMALSLDQTLRHAKFVATVAADQIADALVIADLVRDAVRAVAVGAEHAGHAVRGCVHRGRAALPVAVGEGDEAQPAEVLVEIDLYFMEEV